MPEEQLERLGQLKERLTKLNLDGLLVVRPENRYYLSGFMGTAGVLIITHKRQYLCVDFRYDTQARTQAPDFEVVTGGTSERSAIDLIRELSLKQVGFEEKYVNVAQYRGWDKDLPDVEFVPMDHELTTMRMVKSPAEIERIARAAALADHALSYVITEFGLDHTELEIAWALEKHMREKGGAQGVSFESIVASGPNSAQPHAQPTHRKPQPGEFIVMDFGAQLDYYCSDMTRTWITEPVGSKEKHIYEIVATAQQAALDYIAPGVMGQAVDKVARDIIAEAGYGENFGHGLGHGVGLLVHEAPGLSPGVQTILEPGMVVTVEPGIYLPGYGGVRIEDLVVVTEDGCRILTGSTKEFSSF